MSRIVKFFDQSEVDWFEDTCCHHIYGCQGFVCIQNNDDTWYKEIFYSRKQAEEFAAKFQEMIELAFPQSPPA